MKPRAPRGQWFELDTDDVLGELGMAPTFLARFSPDRLRDELREAGILEALTDRGYAKVRVRVDQVDAEHRLFVAVPRRRTLLLDLRLAEEGLVPDEPWMQPLASRGVLSCLTVRWLALQHPRSRFTRARPRLPGQRHPGLGFGRRVYGLLRGWAAAWGKDALLNQPGYFHNALFYAGTFRFLSARRQGQFEALRRDLAALTPARASWAVERGRVHAVADGERRVVRWEPAPMIDAQSNALRSLLEGASYRDAVAAARESVRYVVVRRSPPQASQGQMARR